MLEEKRGEETMIANLTVMLSMLSSEEEVEKVEEEGRSIPAIF